MWKFERNLLREYFRQDLFSRWNRLNQTMRDHSIMAKANDEKLHLDLLLVRSRIIFQIMKKTERKQKQRTYTMMFVLCCVCFRWWYTWLIGGWCRTCCWRWSIASCYWWWFSWMILFTIWTIWIDTCAAISCLRWGLIFTCWQRASRWKDIQSEISWRFSSFIVIDTHTWIII